MSRNEESMLRAYAASLADAMMSEEGRRGAELMQKLGLLTAGEAPQASARHSQSIGLWEPRTEDGQAWFVRSEERSAEWSLWADVPRIAPRGERRRVVLIGESVARGYFYDPCYTPAQVLEELLSAHLPGGVEVIDLAKNDLRARDLEALLASALALRPEAFVVFAGNNWGWAPSVLREGSERNLAAAVLRGEGAPGFRAWREENLASQVASAVRYGLAPLAKRLGVVLVVPEFNLADWTLDGEADAPWLTDGGNERWLFLLGAAREALAGGRLEDAEALAREMVEIDGGSAASGLTLLADCALRRGRLAEARAFRERARDSHSWDCTPHVPKPLAVIQEAFRKGASEADGIALVDLPRIFGESFPDALPDRRLFLDYCHLTALGIRMAMAAVAERLLPRLGGRSASREELQERAGRPDAATEAEAHFAAAIHNAHWGQPYEVVRYHCGQALAASGGIAEAMACFLDLQTRRAPVWVCESFERLSSPDLRSLRRYYNARHHGKLFDAVLLDAIADGLEEAGVPGRERLEALRRDERGLAAGRPVDFLDEYYRSSYADRSGLWWSSFFYRAYHPVSRFPLVCRSAEEPAALELTWRTPAGGEGDAEGAVSVNGSTVAVLRLSPRWTTQRVALDPDILREGLNTIEIRWPLALGSGAAGLERAARDVEQGRPYLLLPAFAEVHSFRAVPGTHGRSL